MLAPHKRFSIDILQRDDCRDRPISLCKHEDLVPEISGVLGERAMSGRQVDTLHSWISLPPIVKAFPCFRPIPRILTSPLSLGRNGLRCRVSTSGLCRNWRPMAGKNDAPPRPLSHLRCSRTQSPAPRIFPAPPLPRRVAPPSG